MHVRHAVPQMVITPASRRHHVGITFQWPSQCGHESKQAVAYLASALEHRCANGLADAMQRLGWASYVTVGVSPHTAFWLVHVRILLFTELKFVCMWVMIVLQILCGAVL
jgi:secreted Zn-dependent insulinase-like peptidase